jgi:hypothetical protein
LLVESDADATLERVRQLANKEDRRAATAAVCLAIAETDPSKALLAAWDLDLGKFAVDGAENVALEALGERWAEVDLDRALTWAATIPYDEEARGDRVIKGIARGAAKSTPDTATRVINEMMSSDNRMHIDAAHEIKRYTVRDTAEARD